jgi:hypothetical protein
MKRVRVTIHPQGLDNPPLYERITEATYLSEVRTVNWNIRTPPAGWLLRMRGDHSRFADVLDDDPDVLDHEILPVSETEFYCFFEGRGTAAARELWENFTRGSLMTVPPVEWNDDGSSTFTIFGTEADIREAVENVPDPVSVVVEEVGGTDVSADGLVSRLSPRQRRTMEVAVAVGYYEVPRGATVDDVASELDCAASTAAEHLQKAESKLVTALFAE